MKRLYQIFIVLSASMFVQASAFEITERTFTSAPDGGKITITILETTDVHGNVYPYDYFRGKDDDRGLALAATVVNEYRAQNPNTLLLDCGDLIQGSPLTFLFNHKYPEYPNPMIVVLNAMNYDAFTVGNHDIEQGQPVYDKCRRESDFPWLAANAELADGSTYFDPYTIREIGGIRIGILGLCTPGIPLWLNEELYPGIEFKDMVETARKWVPVLREKEKADLLIGLFHAGINSDYDSETAARQGVPLPNASRLVAEQVPGFDLILTGHAHQVIPSDRHPESVFNGVHVIQAGRWAFDIGIVQVEMASKDGRWEIAGISKSIKNLRGVPADSTISALMKEYHEMTLEYTNQVIGTLDVPIVGKTALIEDTPLTDLVNEVQLWATGADVSFTSCFNTYINLRPGDLVIRDVYQIYRYENFLNKVQMSGAQIDGYLEHSVRYYHQYPFEDEIVDGEIRHYNVDTAQGVRYTVDISKPRGDRVSISGFTNGQSFFADSVYTVAVNSYRAEGGGGFMNAAGADKPPVLWKSSRDMRELIIEYFSSEEPQNIARDNNWRIIPPEAEKVLIESVIN